MGILSCQVGYGKQPRRASGGGARLCSTNMRPSGKALATSMPAMVAARNSPSHSALLSCSHILWIAVNNSRSHTESTRKGPNALQCQVANLPGRLAWNSTPLHAIVCSTLPSGLCWLLRTANTAACWITCYFAGLTWRDGSPESGVTGREACRGSSRQMGPSCCPSNSMDGCPLLLSLPARSHLRA